MSTNDVQASLENIRRRSAARRALLERLAGNTEPAEEIDTSDDEDVETSADAHLNALAEEIAQDMDQSAQVDAGEAFEDDDDVEEVSEHFDWNRFADRLDQRQIVDDRSTSVVVPQTPENNGESARGRIAPNAPQRHRLQRSIFGASRTTEAERTNQRRATPTESYSDDDEVLRPDTMWTELFGRVPNNVPDWMLKELKPKRTRGQHWRRFLNDYPNGQYRLDAHADYINVLSESVGETGFDDTGAMWAYLPVVMNRFTKKLVHTVNYDSRAPHVTNGNVDDLRSIGQILLMLLNELKNSTENFHLDPIDFQMFGVQNDARTEFFESLVKLEENITLLASIPRHIYVLELHANVLISSGLASSDIRDTIGSIRINFDEQALRLCTEVGIQIQTNLPSILAVEETCKTSVGSLMQESLNILADAAVQSRKIFNLYRTYAFPGQRAKALLEHTRIQKSLQVVLTDDHACSICKRRGADGTDSGNADTDETVDELYHINSVCSVHITCCENRSNRCECTAFLCKECTIALMEHTYTVTPTDGIYGPQPPKPTMSCPTCRKQFCFNDLQLLKMRDVEREAKRLCEKRLDDAAYELCRKEIQKPPDDWTSEQSEVVSKKRKTSSLASGMRTRRRQAVAQEAEEKVDYGSAEESE